MISCLEYNKMKMIFYQNLNLNVHQLIRHFQHQSKISNNKKECIWKYFYFNQRFKWKKNGETFSWDSNDGKIEHVKDTFSEILIFKHADATDAGSYQCFASNQYGVSQAKPILVKSVDPILNFKPYVKVCYSA